MISVGSCDTEDWSNNCWKFSFTIIEINYILINNISQYYSFLLFVALGENKAYLNKSDPNPLNNSVNIIHWHSFKYDNLCCASLAWPVIIDVWRYMS